MGLNVCVSAAEKFFRPVDGQLLDDVHEFAATIIAFAWVTLGVLVCEHATLGLKNRR